MLLVLFLTVVVCLEVCSQKEKNACINFLFFSFSFFLLANQKIHSALVVLVGLFHHTLPSRRLFSTNSHISLSQQSQYIHYVDGFLIAPGYIDLSNLHFITVGESGLLTSEGGSDDAIGGSIMENTDDTVGAGSDNTNNNGGNRYHHHYHRLHRHHYHRLLNDQLSSTNQDASSSTSTSSSSSESSAIVVGTALDIVVFHLVRCPSSPPYE